jgi:hypothetical protein
MAKMQNNNAASMKYFDVTVVNQWIILAHEICTLTWQRTSASNKSGIKSWLGLIIWNPAISVLMVVILAENVLSTKYELRELNIIVILFPATIITQE